MQTLKIKTHQPNAQYTSHHFFLLSKGYNAGKPLEKSCSNCFALMVKSEDEKKELSWICYSLWKSGKYIPLLTASPIPVLRIKDIQKEIKEAVLKTKANKEQFLKSVQQLQALIKTEKHVQLQVKLIEEIKISVARRFWM